MGPCIISVPGRIGQSMLSKVIKSHPLLFLYDKQVMSQSAYVRISMFAPWHIGHFNNSDDMKNNYQVIWQ